MNLATFIMQSELLLRIVVSSVCGVVIGFERKRMNKEAGIRTHAIVAISAALMMIVSKYGFEDIASYDASRVAAQIVSGIGFLGAGIIFIRNRTISGLTTAAGIWATAGIGMTIGSGLYYIGIVTCLLILFTQLLMHRESYHNKDLSYSTFAFTVTGDSLDFQDVWDQLKKEKIGIEGVKIEKHGQDQVSVEAMLRLPVRYDKMKLIGFVSKYHNIVSTSF